MSQFRFKWTCPYCKHENSVVTDDRQKLLYCDVEQGGCDKLSVVKMIVTTTTEVLKVQGEGEAYDAEREQSLLEGVE